MILTKFIFAQSISSPSNGEIFYNSDVNDETVLNISICGNATARTVNFEAMTESGNWVPFVCYNISNNTASNSTNGITDEIWTTDITGMKAIRCRVSVLTGGTLSIIGRVVA